MEEKGSPASLRSYASSPPSTRAVDLLAEALTVQMIRPTDGKADPRILFSCFEAASLWRPGDVRRVEYACLFAYDVDGGRTSVRPRVFCCPTNDLRPTFMKVLLAAPRGFCAGVNMAIESLEVALRTFGPPLYVFHEIVHNRYVVESFRQRGVVFVEDLDQVPQGANLLFSAHGVSPEIRRLARQRQVTAIDATCPLVTKVHSEAVRFARKGYTILLIGHAGHDEVIGTIGEAPEAMILVQTEDEAERLELPPGAKVAYLTQTTLSVDDASHIIRRLQARFPQLVGPAREDICYATQNRQEAVRALCAEADLVLVVGSRNSSNSQRLRELAAERGVAAHLIDGVDDLDASWFNGVRTVAVTAGASAPEAIVEQCLDYLRQRYQAEIEVRTIREESVYFPLPRELRGKA